MSNDTAVMAGAAIAVGAQTVDNMKRTGDNRRRLNWLSDEQRLLESRFEDLKDSGFIIRLTSPQVSDLLAGAAYPGRPPKASPSPLASAPAALERPDLTEGEAIAPERFPIATNEYDSRGNLTRPDQATAGELFLVGYGLSHPIVRAMLIGLAANGDQPSEDVLAQVFRSAAGQAAALRDLPLGSPTAGLTEEQHRQIWADFYRNRFANRRGVVWSLQADSAAVSATISETAYFSVTAPPGFLQVGESGKLTTNIAIASSYSTDTLGVGVRLNGAAGTRLLSLTPKDPGAGVDGIGFELLITRRPDTALGAVYAVGAVAESVALVAPTFVVGNPSDGFSLSVLGTWASANAANVSTANLAILERL